MKFTKSLTKTLITFVCGAFIGSATLVSAAPSIPALQKQIVALQSQIKALSTENTKLKTENASLKKFSNVEVISGKIFVNGVSANTSKFAVINGETYANIEGIIPVLTNKTEESYKFDNAKKELYIGTFPINGNVSLTSFPIYKFDRAWYQGSQIDNISANYSINGQKVYKFIHWRGDINYKLNGQYSKLTFKYGMGDHGIGTGKKGNFKILADNNVVFDSGELDVQEDMKEATVNITGAKFIILKADTEAWPFMVNPTLIP
jgi:regulator of replication initiation timing